MEHISETHPIRRYFRGLVEGGMLDAVGKRPEPVVDYLSDLVVGRIRVAQEHFMIEVSGTGDPPATVEECRSLQRLADTMLFWSGLFPEQIRQLRRVSTAGGGAEPVEIGKQSYRMVSQFSEAEDAKVAVLFGELSDGFEAYVYVLRSVREQWSQNGFAA